MMTLVVLPPSFSVASFSIFARLTLKKGKNGDHDGVQLQEEDGEHGGVQSQEEMEPGVVWHEIEAIEKRHNGNARVEPDSAMETKPTLYNIY